MRATLAASIALSFLASLALAQSQVTQAVVEPSAPGGYRLSWRGPPPGTPVDVFVANQPNAPRKALQLIVDNDVDGEAQVSPPLKGRPYFYIAANKGTGVWTAERVLPLQGGRNFRDLGGYVTADGRRVKWGRVYRSGSMAELTLTDYDYLSNLGIRVVCDLRTPGERHAEPNKWQAIAKVSYWTRDYETSFGELRKVMASDLPTGQQAKEAMLAGYRELPFEQAPAYRELFKRLVAGETPLAFNCSAGKDRAGTAAALILTALGIVRDTVIEDYALSDKVVDFRSTYAAKGNGRSSGLAKLPPDIVTAILASDPDYIRAALAAIEARHGSVEHYLQAELGVSARDLDTLRKQLLE